jgi:hypothetical protein
MTSTKALKVANTFFISRDLSSNLNDTILQILISDANAYPNSLIKRRKKAL